MVDTIPLRFENRLFTVKADFTLIREIENELGSISVLRDRFSGGSWTVSDLVTLVQMLLQAAGRTVDYLLLGNTMLREGVRDYLMTVQAFLDLVLNIE